MILIQLTIAARIIFMAVYVVVPADLNDGRVTVIEKQDKENRCD